MQDERKTFERLWEVHTGAFRGPDGQDGALLALKSIRWVEERDGVLVVTGAGVEALNDYIALRGRPFSSPGPDAGMSFRDARF